MAVKLTYTFTEIDKCTINSDQNKNPITRFNSAIILGTHIQQNTNPYGQTHM